MAIVSKTPIQRQPGYLYYVKDGYVTASPMKGKPGHVHRASEEYLPQTKGKRCWINKQGYVVIP